MKVILTGATGFIGAEVLHQCLQHPSITSVIALTRRPLSITNPKLKSVMLQDFSTYPSSILSELDGAEACIWSLGAKPTSSTEDSQKINVEYTMAGFNALVKHLTPGLAAGKKFRFVYTSGWLAERDQSRPLWIMSEHRKIRGRGESALVAAAEQNAKTVEVYITRPAMVAGKYTPWLNKAIGMLPALAVDELAMAMIEIGLNGGGKQTWENDELRVKGRELLDAGK